jgi:MSHA biogenesis protein MshN
LSKLLADRKQAGPAAELLTDGLMLLPQESAFALALAPLWMQAGQQDDAMALLAQGSKSANGDPQYHAYYGAQLARLKRHPEAAAHYRTALRAEPSNAEWLVALGISLQASGSLPEALSAFRRAQEIGTLPPQLKTMVQQVVATLSPQVPTDSPRQP